MLLELAEIKVLVIADLDDSKFVNLILLLRRPGQGFELFYFFELIPVNVVQF